MLTFPYGIADFHVIRRDGLVYVDRTAHIRDVEQMGRVLVFLRPRRFGKSLWLQTLANYYDVRRAGAFDEVFGGLAVHREPTPLAGRFFVLQWNFSSVPPLGDVREIAENLHIHVNSQAHSFLSDYREYLDVRLADDAPPDKVLGSLLKAVRETPYKLYLLIDEYDNFVNEVMVRDVKTYRALMDTDGPFKTLFKRVKMATEGEGLERVFVTGVTPAALNDLTSGFNNAEDVTHDPALAGLCGFRQEEVRHLLELVVEERGMPPETVESSLVTMRTWYNGYKFVRESSVRGSSVRGSGELLYNPISTIHYLKALYRHGEPPESLQDQNLRTDQGKLHFLARTATGAGVVEKLTEGEDDEVAVHLLKSFSISDLTEGLRKDAGTVASMLYYMGLLTHAEAPLRLRIPNLVVRKLFLERLLAIYLPDRTDLSGSRQAALDFLLNGDLAPLLAFFEKKLLPVLSNRDRGAAPKSSGDGVDEEDGNGSGVNETTVKVLFLSILFANDYYRIFSEPELEKEYADLCLLTRPEARHYGFRDLLFEFKLVRKKGLGLKGRELREMDDAELRALPKVEKAFADARRQAERYRAALARQEDELDLRTYVVVGVGLERMIGETIDG